MEIYIFLIFVALYGLYNVTVAGLFLIVGSAWVLLTNFKKLSTPHKGFLAMSILFGLFLIVFKDIVLYQRKFTLSLSMMYAYIYFVKSPFDYIFKELKLKKVNMETLKRRMLRVVLFFAVANEIVIYSFAFKVWVGFKLFTIFALVLSFYVNCVMLLPKKK